jgi:O-antigen/teichoic acid export membrane protein
MDKKLTERAFSGFLWMITGSGVQILLKIGVLAVLARLVGPKEFGLIGIAIIILEFSKMFAHMGVGPAIVQRKELENRHLTTGFSLSLLMGAFFAVSLAALAPYLATFFRMEDLSSVLRVVAVVFLIDSFTLIGHALMQRHMKFKTIAAIDVLSYAAGYGAVGITMAFMGWGVWALVAGHIAQAALNALMLVAMQPFPKRPGFELRAFKELIHFGGGMTLARLGNFLANQGDNLIIGRMLGPAALGIYGRAYQFMVMPASLFGNALDKALFPAMAKVQDDKQRLGKAYLTGVSLIALVAIPLSVLLFLLAPDIVRFLLGPEWLDVVFPFQILACSLLFRMSYKMSDSLARATGAVYRRAWRQILYAALVITGSYAGQYWGLPGVAAGVAAAVTINFMLMTHLSLKLTQISWAQIAAVHLQGMALGLLTGFISYSFITICKAYTDSSLVTLIVTGVGVAAILLLVTYYFPKLIIRAELKELYGRLILKKFKNLPA